MRSLLNQFRAKYATLPEQGSEGWLKGRLNSIGGSELATYLNVNQYNPIEKALSEKVGLSPLPNPYDPNFLWGHLWEPIHRIILEQKLNTEMHEMGAIPYGDEGYKSRYKNSPDGVFVVHKDYLNKMFGNIVDHLEYDEEGLTIGMLELKAPVTRKLSGDIPAYYIPQVYSNMCIITPCTFGIYSEIVIRRCRVDDIHDSGYTHTFYRAGMSIDNIDNPKCIYRGIIAIYCSDINVIKHFRAKMNILASDMLCDFGACNADMFFEMVTYWRQGKLDMKYMFIPTNDKLDDVNLLGVCPWKCYDMSLHFQNKQPTYVEQVWPVIELALTAIDNIRAEPVREMQENLIKEYKTKIKVLNAQLNITYN